MLSVTTLTIRNCWRCKMQRLTERNPAWIDEELWEREDIDHEGE